MLAAVGHVLPLAVAFALSSIPIMATILILLSKNRNRSSIPFLIGWILGIALVLVVLTWIAQAVPGTVPRQSQVALGSALIVIGVALIALSVFNWTRGRRNPASGVPRWLEAVSSFGPWSSLGFALLLNVRPKAILLSAAAGLSLRGDGLSPGEVAVVVLIYTLVAASTVAIPIIARLVAPRRTEIPLVNARKWLEANNRIVSALILVLVGFVVIADGLTRL
ncbi:GAP family protein [Diaminobutyricibacter sp. McL0608]|uniref:GAP family protein n=1 Tax=Leifsonia sp. McL0608 TaxID=3143537 RepID=UPI0031F31888